MDDNTMYYSMAWNDLVTERPVIATMAFVDYGNIPRSKIKSYAEDDLGLVGEEVDFFISVMRRVEIKSKSKVVVDPEMTDQASDVEGVKTILNRNARPDKSLQTKKPKVRHPR